MGIFFWRIMISFFLPFFTPVIGNPANQPSSNLTLDSFSLNNTSNTTVDSMSLDLNEGNSSENETNSSEITPPTIESNDNQSQDSDTKHDDKDANSSDDNDHSKSDDFKPIIVRLMFLAEVSRASDENSSNSTITKIQPIISIDAKSSVADEDQPYFAPPYDKENDLISVLKAPSEIVTDDWPTIKYQPIITSTIENITIPMENKTITSPERLTMVNSTIKRSVAPNPAFQNPIKDMLSRLSSSAQPNGRLLPPGATQPDSSSKVNVSGHSVNSADPTPDLDSLRTILALSSQRRLATNSIPNRQSLAASPPIVIGNNTSNVDRNSPVTIIRASSDTVSSPDPNISGHSVNSANPTPDLDSLRTILASSSQRRLATNNIPNRQSLAASPPIVIGNNTSTVERNSPVTIIRASGDTVSSPDPNTNVRHISTANTLKPIGQLDTILTMGRNDRFAVGVLPRAQANDMATVLTLDTTPSIRNVTGDVSHTIRMNTNRHQERILRIPGGDNWRRDSPTTVPGTTDTQLLSQLFRARINSRYNTKVENGDTVHAVDRTQTVNSNQDMVQTRSDQSYNAEIIPQVHDVDQKHSQYPKLRSPANHDLAPAQQSASYKQTDNNQGVASTHDIRQFRPVSMADPVRSKDSKPLEIFNSSSSKTWNLLRNMRHNTTLHNATDFSGVEDKFRLYGNQIPRTGQFQSLPEPTNSYREQGSRRQTDQSHTQETPRTHRQQNRKPFTTYHQPSVGNPPLLQTSRSPSIHQGTPRVESPIHREQNLNNMDNYTVISRNIYQQGSHTNSNSQRPFEQINSEPYGKQLGSSEPNMETISGYRDVTNSQPVVTSRRTDIQHEIQFGSDQRQQQVSPTYVNAAPAAETSRLIARGAFQTQSRPAYTQQIMNPFINDDHNHPLQTSRNQNGYQHQSMGISQVRSPSNNHTYGQQVRIIPNRQANNPPTQEGIRGPSMSDVQSYRHQVGSVGNYYRQPGIGQDTDSSRNPTRDVNLEAPAEYKQPVRHHSSRHDVIPQAQLSGAYRQEIRGANPRISGNVFISSVQPHALHVNGHHSGNPETQSNPRGPPGNFQGETIVTNTPYNMYYPPNQFSNRESVPTIDTKNNSANGHTISASLSNSRGPTSNNTNNIAMENTVQRVGIHGGYRGPHSQGVPRRPVAQASQWGTNGSSFETVHLPASYQNRPPSNSLPNKAHQNISLLELISMIVEATQEPTTSSPIRRALEPNSPHNLNTTLDSQKFEMSSNDMWNHLGQPSRQFMKFITSHPDYNTLISDVANAAQDSSIQHSQPEINGTNLANTNTLGPPAAVQFSNSFLRIQRPVLGDPPDSHGSVPNSNLTQNIVTDHSVNLTEVRLNMLKNIRRALAVTTGSRHPLSAAPVLQNHTEDDLVVMAVDSIMRMEALRSLDCRSISYMYNVNFMDYMPIACDNSCPSISKCVNVGSIGFCCPLYGNYVSV